MDERCGGPDEDDRFRSLGMYTGMIATELCSSRTPTVEGLGHWEVTVQVLPDL